VQLTQRECLEDEQVERPLQEVFRLGWHRYRAVMGTDRGGTYRTTIGHAVGQDGCHDLARLSLNPLRLSLSPGFVNGDAPADT
jgi:hypothetical protein